MTTTRRSGTPLLSRENAGRHDPRQDPGQEDIETAGLTAVFDGNTNAPRRTREVDAGHCAGR
jgi:hypothetical protein